MVFLPPGVGVKDNSGGGHHTSFITSSGTNAYYAVIDHTLSGFQPGSVPVSQITRLQQMTVVASHEMVEAITDPVLGTGWVDYNSKKTDSLSGTEIGDITQIERPAGGAVAVVSGYLVQKYWSENAHTSIAPGSSPFLPVQNNVLSDLDYTSFWLYTEQNGQYSSMTVYFGTPATQASNTYTYQVAWGGGQAVATVSVDGFTDSLNVTITNVTNTKVLFQGTIAPSAGNWQSNDLEMSGTVSQPGGNVWAFGTEAYYGLPGYMPGSGGGDGNFGPGPTSSPSGGGLHRHTHALE
jgi:hypothetical protein